jgi:hypothetical protein
LARKQSKKFVIPKPEIKLTPAQKAMKRAYVVAGIYYGGPDGHAA